MFFTGSGVLQYNPYRGTMKKNIDWWLVVKTDPELVRYYSYQVKKNPVYFNETYINILNPSWGSHISVVRGEEPNDKFKQFWKKYDGHIINFTYSGLVKSSQNKFWFLDVWCDKLNEIRSELGLKIKYDNGNLFHYHLTIGKI